MIRLEHLAARNFRNLEDVDLPVDTRFVVVHGDNAQGKTNLVGAIYLLATLKPLRGHRTRDLVRWGAEDAQVSGVVRHGGLARRYRIDLGRPGRRVLLDGKPVHDLDPYFRGIRAIAFTPADGSIVTGEPRLRRRWIDRAAFTARPSHLDAVRTYARVLEQKAAALKGPTDRAVLDVLDDQLAAAGARLVLRRAEMLAALQDPVAMVHGRIAGSANQLSLRYVTEARGEDLAARVAALRERLAEVRAEEVRRRRTLAGPQTDDVAIHLDGHAARAFGSQGQVRSVVLALKLGELLAAHARGEAPLFLFDDVSSELDAARTARLVDLLRDVDAQVFATTTDPGQLASLPSSDTRLVHVVGGRVLPADGVGI